MITRKSIKHFNNNLSCSLCKGYLIEATTINICMHSFCRSCIIKHLKVFENYFCPMCKIEIRLSNLRPDMRLRSLVYKLVPGLCSKEYQQSTKINEKQNKSLKKSLIPKQESQCYEDEALSRQYFYDQDEPISLSLEYHMESIFGSSIALTNIPLTRYLQAPAAFKVGHLKKFLASKYDLNDLKKPMIIDIIYEGDTLCDDSSLMDIAYSYSWQRDSPLKLFYRIYKGSKHSKKFNFIKKVINQQTQFTRMKMNGLEDEAKAVERNLVERFRKNDSEAPRHDLKIIIAKKSRSKNIKISHNTKIKLNKLNGNDGFPSDSTRLRSDEENVHFTSLASSESASTTSETISNKITATLSQYDSKLGNKNNTKKHSNDSHRLDCYDFASNDREKEENCSAEQQSKHENTTKNGKKIERFKVVSSADSPAIKPNMKRKFPKITVQKTPDDDTYFIATKLPSSSTSTNSKCNTTISKKVHFDISKNSFRGDTTADVASVVDQKEYAERIGLKPVKRKVDTIILHRKHKKSKHSKESSSDYSKRPKLHVTSSLEDSHRLKLKIMGGTKLKRSNTEESVQATTTTTKANKEEDERQQQQNNNNKQKRNSVDFEPLENPKYYVSEQKSIKSGSDQSMIFVPKLVLQKTSTSGNSSPDRKTSSSATTSKAQNSPTNPTATETSESTKPDATTSIDTLDASFNFLKPPRAKMGSPKQPQLSNTFSLSPLSSASTAFSSTFTQPSSTSALADSGIKKLRIVEPQRLNQNANLEPKKYSLSRMPPLVPSLSALHQNSFFSNFGQFQFPNFAQTNLPKFSAKDAIQSTSSPMEAPKQPQKMFSPVAKPFNHPMVRIPLEKIRKSSQTVHPQKFIKPQANEMRASSESSHCNIPMSPIIKDISLERYTLELTHDIAKLDRSLSLEKNFEHWERRKLQEYSKLNEFKSLQAPPKKMLHQQLNLSVRNIPNPSAIMKFRNQNSLSTIESAKSRETVSSTNHETSDIEDILSKATIAKTAPIQIPEVNSRYSPGLKLNEKKSIDKLTEYLRLTAAKTNHDASQDKNNNNNNNNVVNNTKYHNSSDSNRNLMSTNDKIKKFMKSDSVSVYCIDS